MVQTQARMVQTRERQMAKKFLGLLAFIGAYAGGWFGMFRPMWYPNVTDELAASLLIALLIIASYFDLDEKITKLADRVIKLEGKEVVAGASPLALTDYGAKISELIGGQDFAERYVDKIELPTDANEYVIQKACQDYAKGELFSSLGEQEKNKLEKIAFDEGIELEKVLRVIGIEMRDLIFARQRNAKA